jgi:trehalose 6-phosphate synthase/phosphatase
MAGASKELSDAIIVNPNDVEQMVAAMHTALSMPDKQQISNMETMQHSLKRYNIHAWVKLFMERLEHVKTSQNALKTRLLDDKLRQQIIRQYNQAKERLIFLDYDGTLTGFHPNPDDSKPDQNLTKILKKLTTDPKNNVVIISGRGKETLEEWMKPFDLEIVAEHGVWVRRTNEPFKTIVRLDDLWKNDIMTVLEGYVNRTPGSFVEVKDFSLVWHYRKVETGLGEVRTRELTSHLKYMTTNKNLQVLEGDMVVEIKNSEINKGKAATLLLDSYTPDFIMACGDDWTDEDTFLAMPDSAYTIKVGGTASAANYRVSSVDEIRGLLTLLIKS